MEGLRPGEHVLIVGTAHLDQKNPVYHVHEKLILILVVERETGTIIDCDVNVICDLTQKFIRAIFLNQNLKDDIAKIQDCISNNYFGASVKPLIIAAKAARAKYVEISTKKQQ